MSAFNALDEADVIVVGAGSAGCVVASRLSEDSACRVLLIESGSAAHSSWIDIPIGYFKTIGDARFDWRFQTEPEPQMADRQLQWPRGRGLGGTSRVNGMLYLRGHRNDYDRWAQLGNAGWSWADVQPTFEKMRETLHISRVPNDPLSDAFVEAAHAAGIARTDDFNRGDNAGVGYFDMTTRDARRWSTARAYLGDAVRARSNLRIAHDAHVARVLVENGRAIGVEVIERGTKRTIRAAEVIVCAGAVQSPQILQLSGIGDPRLLARHDVPVVAPLVGVGRNLQDHLQVRPVFRCANVETLNEIANSRLRSAREYFKYRLARTGALAWGVYRAGAFISESDAARAAGWPDAQIHFGLVSFDRPLAPPHAFPGVTLSACLLRPESRGRIEIASSDPLAPPRIHANYLDDERDRKLAIALVRRMREIAAQAPLARFIRAEHDPGPTARDDAAILDWIRRRAASIFHPVGTCAMGAGEDAVVDARLRVHGIEGLRVIDGSVMPRVVSGNTNAPIAMLAEHVFAPARRAVRRSGTEEAAALG